jgi:outer membrane PBP1 activator LpoA protein
MNANPQILGFRLNHALALLLNNRPDEAQTLLRPLRPAEMNEEESNAYYLAMLELSLQQQQWENARGYLSHVNRQRLFPVQLAWIENQEKLINSKLPPRT